LLDGVSYVAVIGSLLAMRVAHKPRARVGTRVVHDLHEGVAYAFRFSPIRAALMLLALVSLMGVPYTVLMPIIASDVLGGGPHTYGFLMGATGVGALGGALYLASRRSVVGLGRVIAAAAVVFGVGLIAFSLSRVLALSLALLLVVGAGFMVQMASTNTVLQTVVREDMRGRVMAFYTMAFMGTVPFGSLFAGWLASRIGAPWTLAIGGAACIAGGGIFALYLPKLRALVRPIYVEQGILHDPAEGVGEASQLVHEEQR
jgi:MFS family permease